MNTNNDIVHVHCPLSGAATPVWQVWQLPYLGFWIFQKQVTQWAKSGDIGAKNRKKWLKNLSNGQQKQVSPPLPSLPKWGNAAPGFFNEDLCWDTVVLKHLFVILECCEYLSQNCRTLEMWDINIWEDVKIHYTASTERRRHAILNSEYHIMSF